MLSLSNQSLNCGIFSRNPNKKEGGVKLLDIADQPIGYAAAKKRKKQQEAEDSKKVSGDKSDSKESSVKTEEGNPESTANPTPDYAAGLNPATPAPAPPPAYAPPTPTPIQVLYMLPGSKNANWARKTYFDQCLNVVLNKKPFCIFYFNYSFC